MPASFQYLYNPDQHIYLLNLLNINLIPLNRMYFASEQGLTDKWADMQTLKVLEISKWDSEIIIK